MAWIGPFTEESAKCKANTIATAADIEVKFKLNSPTYYQVLSYLGNWEILSKRLMILHYD